MKDFLMVGLGGCLGAAARYQASLWLLPLSASTRFPLATCAVNVVGCLLAGVLLALFERPGFAGHDARLFLMTGVLGGFTTFSAFGLETLSLLRRNEPGVALAYVGTSLALGLAAAWLGFRLASAMAR